MKKLLTLLVTLSIAQMTMAQVYTDSSQNMSAKRVQFADIQQFAIGSYGEVHYNQSLDAGNTNFGKLDLHRIITYLGYRFNDRLQFFSEIEFEHTNELAVEQAFLNYRFDDRLNVKAGLLLIPMGYVNEFHEPTLFNGVERPNVDKYIVPSTWRETGAGIQGLFKKTSMKYQLYVVNGFKGYDNKALVSGQNGLRSARQGGGNSFFSSPSFTGKLSYYGINNLLIEASGYYGETESTLYGGFSKDSKGLLAQADSSTLGVGMAGINLSYAVKNLLFRAQGIYTSLSNTKKYNAFTNSDVANGIFGYYGELSYTIDLAKDMYLKLTPFARYENYDTHFSVDSNVKKDKSYNREEITLGLGLWLAPGMIIKADHQLISNASTKRYSNLFNLGFGYWF